MRVLRSCTVSFVCLMLLCGWSTLAGTRVEHEPLTFEQRLEAQRAIERVFYRHRLWPGKDQSKKPVFEDAVSPEEIALKVRETLKKSSLLNDYWKTPITGALLQSELNRMIRQSKDPDMLRELFEVLNNDAYIIVECLVRPFLVDQLIREKFAYDERIHGGQRKELEALHATLSISQLEHLVQGEYHVVHFVVIPQGTGMDDHTDPLIRTSAEYAQGIHKLDQSSFNESVAYFPHNAGEITLEEEPDAFVFRLTQTRTEIDFQGAFRVLAKQSFHDWFAQQKAGQPACCDTSSYPFKLTQPKISGGSFLPDSWSRSSNAPIARRGHTAVWTGTEMIVWGGYIHPNENEMTNTGGRYNPATDTWLPVTLFNAPSIRAEHSVVWTGSEMIVWGGYPLTNTGGRYNPSLDQWISTSTGSYTPSPRHNHSAVWDGQQMIIWGGWNWETSTYYSSGSVYNPTLNEWNTIYASGSPPSARAYHTATMGARTFGTIMIIWGGYDGSTYLNTGSYLQNRVVWFEVSTSGSPPVGRVGHTAIWNGEHVVIAGGNDATSEFNDCRKYNLNGDSWTSIAAMADARTNHTAVWTGEKMIVWGGIQSGNFLQSGEWNDAYNDSVFIDLNTDNQPSARAYHTAVWTGNEMIIWGGRAESGLCDDGGRYNPNLDASLGYDTNEWIGMSTVNAPSARQDPEAVWTGAEMIVWGGVDSVSPLNTGGRYLPAADLWLNITTENAPEARYVHTMIWTGTEMIAWGGGNGTATLNTGGRYDPILDSWETVTTVGAPGRRSVHTAIWTGTEMIVWGGSNDTSPLNTGGCYNPLTDTWRATSLVNVPVRRNVQTAIWTGTEMIIWGGLTWSPSVYLNTGGRYNPMTDTWTATDSASATTPGGRRFHTAVWTGTDMIIWGGRDAGGCLNTGSLYNPATDTWTDLFSSPFIPSARMYHSAVWNGTLMYIWGGYDGTAAVDNTPYGYNPYDELYGESGWWFYTNGTPPSARHHHCTVWAGDEMIVWGGFDDSINLGDGGRLQDIPGSWAGIEHYQGITPRSEYTATWTGSEMIIWGGVYNSGYGCEDGFAYYPGLDLWKEISSDGAPEVRMYHTSVWSGTEMIVWGGIGSCPGCEDGINTGGRYNPTNNTWTATSLSNAPSARYLHTAVWADSYGMIVWGGNTGPDSLTMVNTGGMYTPDSWSTLSVANAPEPRVYTSSIWTGSEMIVWGGLWATRLNTGGSYNPESGNWQTLLVDANTPSVRNLHSAVWTGTEMIIWGGQDDSLFDYADGACYRPDPPSWTVLPSSAAPEARERHTALWTGAEMIVWGGLHREGVYGYFLNTGGSYDVARNTWLATPTENAPTGFSNATTYRSIWTGSSMISWGGDPSSAFGVFFPNTYPTSAPDIVNALDQITLSDPPDEVLQLTHTLSTSNVWDQVEGLDQWTSTGHWHVVDDQDCSGIHDYYSNSRAWYCGDSSICSYDTGLSVPYLSLLNLIDPVSVTDGPTTGYSYLTFRYLLDTDSLKADGDDIAFVEISVDGGVTWTRVATDVSHWLYETNGVKLDDDCSSWQSVSIKLNDFVDTSTALLSVRFGFYQDMLLNDHLGWLIDDIGIGKLSGDGCNVLPYATIPYHDQWDQATFEWDLDGDGFPDNPDLLTPVWDIPEEDLENFGLAVPGLHTLTLTVTDVLGLSDSQTVALDVVDGIAPTAVLISPNGGESWTFSESVDQWVSHLIVWDSDDNFGLTRTRLLYTTDGILWTPIVDTEPLISTALDTPLAIPDPGETISTLTVTDCGPISDLNVTVNIAHTAVGDLILSLVGPDSTEIILSANNGSTGTNYTDTIFDDQASSSILSGTPPFTGSFQPEQPLSTFVGNNMTGNWSLKVVDSSGNAESGSITSWSMTIESSLEPDDTNYLWIMPTQAEAAAAGQTFPSAECKIQVEVCDSSNNCVTDESDNNFYIIQPTTTAVRTLILWDAGRIEGHYGSAARDALALKLVELADHNKVSGVVRDLSSVTAVHDAYSLWDAAPTDQGLANAVAQAIWDYLYDPSNGQITTVYNNVRYLVLVGDDVQIPFYRMTDGTSIHSESLYPGEVGLNTSTTVGSAIAAGYFLTDNFYTEFEPEASNLVSNDWVYQNDLAIGRLVETPDQIAGTINTFLARDGQVNLTQAADEVLVTGFDFFYDSACAIGQSFAAQETTDWLLDAPAGESADCGDVGYTYTTLGDQVFSTPPHKLGVISTHAHHFGWAASDLSVLTTNEMTTGSYAGQNLSGTVVYSSGCHSGLPVPATDTNPLDLPETVLVKGALAYIGNTGYGWGIRYGRGLTEKLMEYVSNQILAVDSVSIGNVLAQAKRQYYLEGKRYDVFDEKVSHELTLFGIPNTLIVTDLAKDSSARATLPGPAEPDQGCAEGICLSKTIRNSEQSKAIPPGMTELDLNFSFGPATYQMISTSSGDYYQLNGRSSDEVGDTLQPQFVYDSQLSGTNAHGVTFSGGSYMAESSFGPVVGVPQATELSYLEGPLPLVSGFTPCVHVSYGTAGGSAQKAVGEAGYTTMVVHTGYFEEENDSSQVRFNDLQMTIYYSNSSDVTPPSITDPGPGGFHTLDGLVASFQVEVGDDTDVYRVLITYNDYRTSIWDTFDLTENVSNWQGSLTLKGNIRYFVQAVDTAGNIGLVSLTGPDLNGDEPPVPYGSTWEGPQTYEIVLADTDDDGLPDLYEDLYFCLDSGVSDADADPDYDYLTNLEEFGYDTDPCDGDTDGGGDNDGSEYNNGRKFMDKSDDLYLSIEVDKVYTTYWTYTIGWSDGFGVNDEIDGYYFVYRSDTPFFDPSDLISTALPDSTKSFEDVDPPCTTCYYQLWNYQLDTQPPIVGAVVPASGTELMTHNVTIYGQHFQTGATVTFCGTNATNVNVVSEYMLTCTTPALAQGSCDVTVINPNNQEGTLEDGYTYLP
ncbi:proprotein convertase P-domain-containing protein [bacterium]|nr:proprotein convertase P-domain-containing protein [bacterium]